MCHWSQDRTPMITLSHCIRMVMLAHLATWSSIMSTTLIPSTSLLWMRSLPSLQPWTVPSCPQFTHGPPLSKTSLIHQPPGPMIVVPNKPQFCHSKIRCALSLTSKFFQHVAKVTVFVVSSTQVISSLTTWALWQPLDSDTRISPSRPRKTTLMASCLREEWWISTLICWLLTTLNS